MLKLFIGNKNYSSWSMRPWVLLRQLGLPFEETKLRFDSFASDSQFKQALRKLHAAGKVPVLLHQELAVWDTLAIAEYVQELYPQARVWPHERADRARARSVCCEMHAGFTALRAHCPMNIEASLPEIGALVWRDQPAVREDLARISALWDELLQAYGGPMLFGEFSHVDAYFAPVCMRIHTYALPVPARIAAYVQRVRELEAVQAWMADALQEKDFLAFEEPYRLRPQA